MQPNPNADSDYIKDGLFEYCCSFFNCSILVNNIKRLN